MSDDLKEALAAMVAKHGKRAVQDALDTIPGTPGRPRREVSEAELNRIADGIVADEVKGRSDGIAAAAAAVLAQRMDKTDPRWAAEVKMLTRAFVADAEDLLAGAVVRAWPQPDWDVRPETATGQMWWGINRVIEETKAQQRDVKAVERVRTGRRTKRG